MNVIVTGSLGFDYIMDFPGIFSDRIMPDKIHNLSLSFLVDKLNKNFGGTAGNIAYSLKLLGIEPIILSSAGNDFSPYRKFLLNKKISVKQIKIAQDVITGSYFVVTDKEDNQIGSFYIGASKYNKNLKIINLINKKNPINFVVIAPNHPQAMNNYIQECIKLKLSFMFDPAFQIDNFSNIDLLKGISHAQILIANDYEIALILSKLKISHEKLTSLVPILITTLGAKGSIIENNHKKITIKPAKPKNVSDPTGAGDAYRAGFLAGYLRGFDLNICGQMGSIAAVYTVEKYGTITHDFSIREFVKRYKTNYKEQLNLKY